MSTLTPIASVMIAVLVLWLNVGARRDAQFRRVDDLLTAFQTGELAATRHLLGVYRHAPGFPAGWDTGIDGAHDPAKPHTKALFDVMWYFKRVDAAMGSLYRTGTLPFGLALAWRGRRYGGGEPRRLLLRSLEADVETWWAYLTVLAEHGVIELSKDGTIVNNPDVAARPNVYKARAGLERVRAACHRELTR